MNTFLTKIRKANNYSYEASIPIKVVKYHGLVSGDIISMEIKGTAKAEELKEEGGKDDSKEWEELFDKL